MTSKVIAPDEQQPRRYELWRPIIRPERRAMFERVHHRIAESWSHTMRGYLPNEKRFEFQGLGFEHFREFNSDEADNSQVVVFAIEQSQVVGLLLLGRSTAQTLVNSRLGIGAAPSRETVPAFTRIEMGILREAIRALLARLSTTYFEIGLGRVGGIRECERLGDTLMFAPEDYLAVLRFRLGSASDGYRITVALSSNAVNAFHEVPSTGAAAQSRDSEPIAGELPIPVDVVLGTWRTSIRELSGLRPGDQIILPDGENGWLAAGDIRLRSGTIQFDGRQTGFEIKPSVRLR